MIIITGRSKAVNRKSGFTITELLVAISIGTLFLGVAMGCLNMLGRSAVSVGNYADMNASSRRALERFGTDVRMAVNVISSTDSELEFWMYDNSYSLIRVKYWYDSGGGEVYRDYGGSVVSILKDVEIFDFEYYDLTHVSTSNALSVKEVEINASLRRSVLSLSNTNEIISARFMMRNRQVSS